MRKFMFLSLTIFMIGFSDYLVAQAPEWTRVLQTNTFGSSNMNAVHSDSAYVYVAGTISGPVTYESVNFNPVGLRDLLLTRIDKSGITSWVKQFPAGPNSTITPHAVTSDAGGNIYVYSLFSGTVTIGGNTLTSDLTTNSFLAKFDADGNDLWATSLSATGNGVSKIILDDMGNPYLQSRTSKLLKFDPTGAVLWEQSYVNRTLQSIAISGNYLLVAGNLQTASTTFGSITLNSVGGYNTGYLLKADLDGNYISSLVVEGSTTADGSSVSSIISDNSGNLFITGAYTENLVLGGITIPNTAASFNNYTYVAKCDTSFEFNWVITSTQFYNPNRDMTSYRLYHDAQGNIYQYGANSSTFEYESVTVNPNSQQFLAKFDTEGTIMEASPLENTTSVTVTITPEGKLVHVGSLFVNQYLVNMSPEWEKSSTSTDQSGTVDYRYIRHDNSGNTYLQSRITGYVDFYGTIIDTDIPLTLISKHDVNGNLQWLEQIPDKSVDNFGPAFTLDDNNNVYTIGLFKDTLMIGATQLTSLNTGDEGYVAKYNSDGVLQWASVFGMGTNVYISVTLAVDKSGNAIVSGVQAPANFLLKFDPSGNKLWEKSFPMDSQYLSLVAADSSGNIYLASELHLSDGTGSATIGSVTLNQTYDDGATALIKFDPDGNTLWAKTYGGLPGASYSDGWPTDIETDKAGNTYLWGWAVNNAVIGPYTLTNPVGTGYSYFLTKISTSGDVEWANAVYEKTYSFNYGDLLELDDNGNIYAGGHFKDIIIIDGNQFTPETTNDFFLAKFSNNGSFTWLKSLPVGTSSSFNSISASGMEIYIAGSPATLNQIGSFMIDKKGGTSAVIATLSDTSVNESLFKIEPASKPATNDGIIDSNDPWTESGWVDLAVAREGNVGDMSAKFQMQYDADNLYFAVQVKDHDRFVGNAATYLNDCIEFFIAMDTTSGVSGTYKTGDNQFRLQAVEDPLAPGGAIEINPFGNGSFITADFTCTDQDSGYIQEWTLPWAELTNGMNPAWDQKQFKFDLMASNATADGVRTQQMFWNSNSDLQWNNTNYFGLVTLETPVYQLIEAGNSTDTTAAINKAGTMPVIDGIIDSVWAEASKYNIVKNFNGETPTVGLENETYWKALWTDEGIYVVVHVEDNIFSPGYAGNDLTVPWMYDKVELYFDVNPVLQDGRGPNIGLGHYQVAPEFINGQTNGTQVTSGDGVVHAFLVNGASYNAEYFIPFTKLLDKDGNQFNRFASIGFDVTVSDNDVTAPVRNRAVWQNTGGINESYYNMDDCGTLTFNGAGTFIPITSLTLSPEGGNNSIDWDNGSLQMNVSVVPSNASYQYLDWAITGGTGDALVDGYGLITARKNGTVTVTATTKDGTNLSSSATINLSNQFVSLADFNILKDGAFPKEGNAIYPWEIFSPNGGTAIVKAGVLNVFPASVDLIWYMSVNQKNWTAYQDSSYVLSFTAWSDAARTFVVDIEDLGNNYTRPGSSSDPESINGRSEWTVSVTPTTPRRFTFHTTMDSVKANTIFLFNILASNDINPIYIDDISLVPASSLTQLDELPAPTAAVVKKATLAPVIDGNVDTIWNHANTYNIDRKFTGENPTLGAPGASTWKALWTNLGIYVLLQVSDDVFFPPYAGTDSSASWNYDKPELYFDVNPVKRDGKGAGWFMGHYQVAPAFISGQVNGTQFTDGEGVVHAFNVSGANYTAEYFIPYTKLLDQSGNMVKRTDTIGFDVTINDRDNELQGRQRAVWTNFGALGESWYNMDGAGIITLDGATNDIPVTGLTISAGGETTISTEAGTLQFTATAVPANATNKEVVWSVTNGTGRAQISADGLLRAFVDGTVTVTATTTDGTNISASQVITISNQGYASGLIYSLIGTAFYKADGVTVSDWNYDTELLYTGTSGHISRYEIKNIEVLFNGEFKVRKDKMWNESWGPYEMPLFGDSDNFVTSTEGPNFKALSGNIYDVIFRVDLTNYFPYSVIMDEGSQIVITDPVADITPTSANFRGEIWNEGASPVISRGFCWNTAPEPSLDNSVALAGSGIGTFTADIAGLDPQTTYYVRAFALTATDTLYGNEITFSSKWEIIYSSSIKYFHPTAGGSYPDEPYGGIRNLDKTLHFSSENLAETWFALWDTVRCSITIYPDNSVGYSVYNWSVPVIQGDPNDASKVSYYDPATGKIYLYYYYFGTGGNRIFWEELSPPPPPTAPESLSIWSPYIPLTVESGTNLVAMSPFDVNKKDTHTMELVEGYGDNALFRIYYDLLQANSDLNFAVRQELDIKIRVTDNTGLSAEFEKVIYANSDAYEIKSVTKNDTVGSINELSVINDDVIWIQDNIDRVARTVDGGETWEFHAVPSENITGYGPLFAIDANTAWLLVSQGDPAIYRTVNGGDSWVRQSTAYNASSFPDIIYFWNNNEGFTMGDTDDQGYMEIYTTSNGGVNWIRVPQTDIDPDMFTTVNTQSIMSVYKDTVWVSGNDGLIFRSPDKGHTWEAFQSPASDQSTILFMNGQDGIIAPIGGTDQYVTHDGGESWSLIDWLPDSRSTYQHLSRIPGTGFIAMSNYNELYFSDDLGTNWQQAEFLVPQVYNLSSINSSSLWAGTSLDRVLKINLSNLLPCKSDFSYTLNEETGQASFTSLSAGEAAYYWDFGNGDFSTLADPQYTFTEAGLYNVCLTVQNSQTGCQAVSCREIIYEPEGEPFITADFSFVTSPTGNTVTFTDLSTGNATDWYWTMGDGKVLVTQNPVYTYSNPGIYSVCLTAIDKDNVLVSTVCKDVVVGTPECFVKSDFLYFIDPSSNQVVFLNNSEGDITDYYWIFGDGSTSTAENPVYAYSQPGYYLVSLSVRNSVGKCLDVSAEYIQVGSVDCRAGFTYGLDPLTNTVSFVDESRGDIEYYYWDFGNGSFSTDQNPSKTYARGGIYLVGLTVIDNSNGCIDQFYQPVQVGEVDCSAGFVAYIDSSANTAYFTNRSIGETTALLWSFGDGRFSTLDNPVHQYANGGIYTVGLNTYDFNTACMDYAEEVLLVGGLGVDCEADFAYILDPSNPEIIFSNRSIGDIVSSVWNFGDNTENSTETDPVHTFQNGGYYYVCLNVMNSSGIRNMTCKWVLVAGDSENDCRANFNYTVDSATLEVKFVDNSFGNIDKYTWDFGDSAADSVSSERDPSHTYNEKGYYLVRLKAENTVTGCVSNEYKLLNVAENQVLKAAFGYEALDPDKKVTGYPVDLVSASSGDGATIEWDFGDKQQKKDAFTVMDSTSGKVTHYYQLPGKYLVCLRISDPVSGQSDTYCDFVTTKNFVNVPEVSQTGLEVNVYPNPFTDNTTISYYLPENQYIELSIFDQLGRRLETLVKQRMDTGDYQVLWNASGYATGVYHLKLITPGGILTRQMVITR